MLVFDLKNAGSGEWFPFFGSEIKPDGDVVYFDPEPNTGKMQLRVADSDVMDKIQKETRTKKVEHIPNPKSRGMERIEYFDQTPEQAKLERELIWDHAIENWEDKAPFLNADGSPIERTIENKLKLMAIPVCARFDGMSLQLIEGAAKDIKEAAVKN